MVASFLQPAGAYAEENDDTSASEHDATDVTESEDSDLNAAGTDESDGEKASSKENKRQNQTARAGPAVQIRGAPRLGMVASFTGKHCGEQEDAQRDCAEQEEREQDQSCKQRI